MLWIGIFIGLCVGFLIGWCGAIYLTFAGHRNSCPVCGSPTFDGCPACEDYL